MPPETQSTVNPRPVVAGFMSQTCLHSTPGSQTLKPKPQIRQKAFDLAKLPPIISKTPHTIVGSAMSLLLVFRTNAAYTRFWEGRGIWEGLINKSRDLSRMVASYCEEIGAPMCRRMADLICAFPVALEQHLLGFQVCNPGPLRAKSDPTPRAAIPMPLASHACPRGPGMHLSLAVFDTQTCILNPVHRTSRRGFSFLDSQALTPTHHHRARRRSSSSPSC